MLRGNVQSLRRAYVACRQTAVITGTFLALLCAAQQPELYLVRSSTNASQVDLFARSSSPTNTYTYVGATSLTVDAWEDRGVRLGDSNLLPIAVFSVEGVNAGYYRLRESTREDFDADGLANMDEYRRGTDPEVSDTDADGMSDSWEVDNGFNPLDPTDAAGDADGDSLTNETEAQLGTDPRSANSIVIVGPAEASLTCREITAMHQKCGVQEFTETIEPPQIYRRMDVVASSVGWKNGPGYSCTSGTSQSAHSHEIAYGYSCDPDTEVTHMFYLDGLSDSSESVSSPGCPTWWSACSASMDTNGQWQGTYSGFGPNFPHCTNQAGCPQDIPYACWQVDVTGGETTVTNTVRRIVKETQENPPFNGVQVDSYEETLSDLYSTADLVGRTLASLDACGDLDSLQWGERWESSAAGCLRTNDATCNARRMLFPDEMSLILRRLQYCISFETTADNVYRISWIELLEGEGITNVVRAMSTHQRGTGSRVYLEPQTIEPPDVNGTVRPIVLQVEIREPDGIPLQSLESGDSAFRFEPSCFEWQYVHPDHVVIPYSQFIEGIVQPSDPPLQYYWTASAGVMSAADTATPTLDISGMAVPSMMTEITLTLCPQHGCNFNIATRRIEVYRDHLERDYCNFGTRIECGAPLYDFYWSFNKYGTNIWIPHSWNCFGSVWHAFDGTHDGSVNDSVPSSGFTVATYDDPIPWATALTGLGRGDIVSFYKYDPGTETEIRQHAHMCLGSASQMYGANNEPVYGYFGRSDGHGQSYFWEGGSFRWWVTSSSTYYDQMNAGYESMHPGAGKLINRIKVHRR